MLAGNVDVPTLVWVAATAFVVAVGPLAVIAVRQMWRDDERWRTPPSFWISGLAQWYGAIRATLAALLALSSIFLLAPVFALFEEGTTAFALLVLGFTCAGFAFLGLSATTFLFNWPRFLVPPPRRQDRAAVREAWRFLSGRHHEDAGTAPPRGARSNRK